MGTEPERAAELQANGQRGRFHVLLTTFEYLMGKNDRPRLARTKWAYLMMDEAHRIKNSGCKLNRELGFYSFERRLLVSGTPVQNNLQELWTLLNFLMPSVFDGDGEAFQKLFEHPFDDADEGCGGGGRGGAAAAAAGGGLNEEERMLLTVRMHEALRPFMLRRTKEKVCADLPAKKEARAGVSRGSALAPTLLRSALFSPRSAHWVHAWLSPAHKPCLALCCC